MAYYRGHCVQAVPHGVLPGHCVQAVPPMAYYLRVMDGPHGVLPALCQTDPIFW